MRDGVVNSIRVERYVHIKTTYGSQFVDNLSLKDLKTLLSDTGDMASTIKEHVGYNLIWTQFFLSTQFIGDKADERKTYHEGIGSEDV